MEQMEDMYTKIDRQLVTQTTQLDLMMDECYDASDYNDLEKEYRRLLRGYDLFDASFVEHCEQMEWEDDEDIMKDVYEDHGKYGVRKNSWHVGLPAVYDKIECPDDGGLGVICVYKDGKIGLMGLLEEACVIFDPVYDDINNIRYEQYVLKKDGKYIYWNDGRASEPFDNIHVPRFAGWIKVCKDGEWGWLGGHLQFTINLQDAHEHILDLGRGKARIGEYHNVLREELDMCSKLDEQLATCQESEYEDAEKTVEEFCAFIADNPSKTIFCQNGKSGVKDFLDFAIIPAEYDEVIFENDYTAYGRKQNRWGIIIMDGSRIANPRIEFDKPPTSRVYGNWQEVQVNGKWGLYNPDNNKYIFEPVFDDLCVQEGYQHIVLKKDGKYGFYDGCFTVPCDYEDIWWGRTLSFVRFKKNGQWGYMDAKTNWVENIEKARIIAIKLP